MCISRAFAIHVVGCQGDLVGSLLFPPVHPCWQYESVEKASMVALCPDSYTPPLQEPGHEARPLDAAKPFFFDSLSIRPTIDNVP